MPPDIYKELKIDTRGEFGGLGIEITLKDEFLTIVTPIEDTPAFRAGVEAGDRIYKIGNQLTKGMEVMEAVRLMRGVPGSEVTISVMRDSFERPKEFTLKREIIKIKSVKSKILEEGFGYARVTQFQERTGSDLEKALEALSKENNGPLRGLVLDLRNNPGGLLDQAVEMADLFLADGKIVYTKGREADAEMEFNAKRSAQVFEQQRTADVAEAVAGAHVETEAGMLIAVLMAFGKWTRTIQPVAAWLASTRSNASAIRATRSPLGLNR